jgi:hypothetical protein
MMQKVKSFFLFTLVFFIFAILGIAVGFGTGYVVNILHNDGLFSSWKLLDGSLKFKQIVDVTSQTIWARTAEEKLYSWDTNCYREPKCNTWVETKDVPDDIHYGGEIPISKDRACQLLDFKFLRQPPGNVVECVRAGYSGPESGVIVYYALLSDGKILAWKFSGSVIDEIFLPVFFSFAGLILGITAFIVSMIRRRGKNKIQAI